MGRGVPDLIPIRQIPDLDDTITTATRDMLQRIGILGDRVHTVHMSASQLPDERLRMHALQLDGREGALVLAGSLEGVQRRVEVAGLLGGIRAWGLMLRDGATQSLDLHREVLLYVILKMFVPPNYPRLVSLHFGGEFFFLSGRLELSHAGR